MARIEPNKFNEITYAILQLANIVGYDGDESHTSVYSRYPSRLIAAYKARCEELDADDAGNSDTEGTY